MPAEAVTRKICGQPSWQLRSSTIEAWITQMGGHVGPVSFTLAGRKIAPLSVAPWYQEKLDASVPTMLRVLRGDFFCMPFGGNARPYRRERHPPHGQTASAPWKLIAREHGNGRSTIHLSLQTTIRRAQVDKLVTVRDGQTALYQEHIIRGGKGPMNLGQHAMLKFPDAPGSGLVSTSKFIYGQVYPAVFEAPENRGYQMLKPGAEFTSLSEVPTLWGDLTDLSRYPARRGFEDLVLLVTDPAAAFGWTAVVFPKERYVWFALKDPRVLPQTIFWLSNGGRHYAPWNSRHVSVLGLEEVCSYFHGGIAESVADNPLRRRGSATYHTLDPRTPLRVRYIMAVAQVPPGFDHVDRIEPSAGGVALVARNGKAIRASVDADFLAR